MPEAVVRVLIEAGIDMVFGVPAGNSTRIFNALADHTSTIRTVLVREESLAGVMAEVYGRMTGRPGVVVGQSAFIITNALLGTLEGHLSSSPMVLIGDLTDDPPYSHHGPYQVGTGEYGGFDAKQMLAGATKMAAVAYDPGQFVQQVQLALKRASRVPSRSCSRPAPSMRSSAQPRVQGSIPPIGISMLPRRWTARHLLAQ